VIMLSKSSEDATRAFSSIFKSIIAVLITQHATCKEASSISSDIVTLKLISKREVVRRLSPHERNLQLFQSDSLYQGYGTHYVDLWVGTPVPQRQTVIVDTGSSITAFPCFGCKGCGEDYHTDKFYDYSASQSFKTSQCGDCVLGSCASDQCHLSMSYAEGSSWNAFEAKDLIYTGGPHDEAQTVDMHDPNNFEFELSFGCQNKITGLFITQLADGILGMSRSQHGTFWYQMYKAGKIKKKVFSLCFSRQPVAERKGTGAGVMTMGGTDATLHRSPMVFAHDKGSTFYTVHVEAVYLRSNGGESASVDVNSNLDHSVHKIDISEKTLNGSPIIVDSGTTDTYFNRNIMEPFTAAWKAITGHDYDMSSIKLTHEQLLKMPTVLIQIKADPDSATNDDPDTVNGLAGSLDSSNPKSIIIAVPASHYMEYSDGKYTSRLYLDERGGTVLGANTMQGHDVFFDIENKRIGFAESACNTEVLPIDTRKTPTLAEKVVENFLDEDVTSDDLVDDDNFCASLDCQIRVLGMSLVVLVPVVYAVKRVRSRNLDHVPISSDDIDGLNDIELSVNEGEMS